MSTFKWTPRKRKAAEMFAEGHTNIEVCSALEISERTVTRWRVDISFMDEVDRLTMTTGIAVESQQIREIKRMIEAKRKADGTLTTEADSTALLNLLNKITTSRAGSVIQIDGYEDMLRRVYGG